MEILKITTLGQLKNSGYQSISIKEELKKNLIVKLKNNEPLFESVIGYQDSVIPDVERALLSRHNILFLGLRGQAKTRMARLMVNLLDEYIPYISDTELRDDPLNPISYEGKALVEKLGDYTPISWWHRDDRYVEKLATPDVSVADLIGDVDPIKAAVMKLPYSDPRVLHYGLIPRSHRSIFVINELPDLQARIQVALFNILQEGDIQIRGFKMALPLDIFFTFTANPEDYTSRGSIITPLKDRIESQILTHYPSNVNDAMMITEQEAKIESDIREVVDIQPVLKSIVERISFVARESEYIDESSGVSARLSISALENVYSAAFRRAILNKEEKTIGRISDLRGVIPAITGKVELEYEGEQMGAFTVAQNLVDEAIKEVFLEIFPNPNKQMPDTKDPYGVIKEWFGANNKISIHQDITDDKYKNVLTDVAGLEKVADFYLLQGEDKYLMMELILHGLAAMEVISREEIVNGIAFNDPLSDMWDQLN